MIQTIRTASLQHKDIKGKHINFFLQKENETTYNLLTDIYYINYRGTKVKSNQLHYLSYNLTDALQKYEDRILNYINKKGFSEDK